MKKLLCIPLTALLATSPLCCMKQVKKNKPFQVCLKFKKKLEEFDDPFQTFTLKNSEKKFPGSFLKKCLLYLQSLANKNKPIVFLESIDLCAALNKNKDAEIPCNIFGKDFIESPLGGKTGQEIALAAFNTDKKILEWPDVEKETINI